jgi:methylenetetrahydrofolate--tRNA-(uracil-5-)-methyltransferase
MLVGIETAARLKGKEPVKFPKETAVGALSLYISENSVGTFQPININFGILSPLGRRVKGKRNKNAEISARSLGIMQEITGKENFK